MTTSSTGTVTPLAGQEIVVTTIVGGPFDLTSTFVQGGQSLDGLGQLTYRLYALTSGLLTLIAESTVLGSAKAAILQWQSPGSGDTESEFVAAGGTAYTLTVTAIPAANAFQNQTRLPVTVTLAGTELLAVTGNTNISPSLTLGPFQEASSSSVPGYVQTMDVAVNQSLVPSASQTSNADVTVKIFASNGPGTVEAIVEQTAVPPGPDGVTAVLRQVRLPVASAYRVSVLNNTKAVIPVFPIGIATSSVIATAGTTPLTPAGGDIGVTGPSNANFITPVAPLAGEALLATPAPAWQSAVGVLAPPGLDNPYWDQATWFIDPQNVTGLASDSNSGIDAAHPVLSFNGGIATKWGTYAPRIRVTTVLTWLSSQLTSADPVILHPVMDAVPPANQGAYLTLTGGLGPAQELHAGVLAGVIAKNRPTAQLLTADLGAALPPGTLIMNTTKGSSAWVYELVSGTTYAISQPLVTFSTLPIVIYQSAEDDTWANGDSFVAYEPISVNLVEIVPTIATYEFAFAGFIGQLQALNLVFSSFAGASSGSVHIQNETSIAQCRFDKPVDDDTFNDVVTTGFSNCYFKSGLVSSNASDVYSIFFGGVILNGTTTGFAFDLDAIVNCGTGMIFRSPFSDPFITDNRIGFLYIAGKSIWNGTWDFTDGYDNLPLVWGPGVFEAQGAGTRIYYSAAQTAVAVWENLGGLLIDDQTVASTFNPTTNLWSGPFPMTPASLDNPAELNGLALNSGGASYSSQGTP